MEKSKLVICLLVTFLLPYVSATVVSGDLGSKHHFVLVHGECHGAWSWYKIIALLRSSGHNVTPLDLIAFGIDPEQPFQPPHLSDYFRPLMDFMTSLPAHEKIILVGHSYGGFAISKAMEVFPEKISVAVFVTALMPGPTLNATTVFTESIKGEVDALDNRVTYDNGPTKPPTTFIYGPKYLATNAYQLSPIQDYALVLTLIRPIYFYTLEDLSKEIVLSKNKYGSVRRVYILATEDKVHDKEFQQMMVKKNPPDEVEEIGSDKMTMMSRPLQLFALLQHIANK